MVERTCAEQGVPLKVEDPVVLGQVMDLLGRPDGRTATARQRGRSARPPASEAPDGPNALDLD